MPRPSSSTATRVRGREQLAELPDVVLRADIARRARLVIVPNLRQPISKFSTHAIVTENADHRFCHLPRLVRLDQDRTTPQHLPQNELAGHLQKDWFQWVNWRKRLDSLQVWDDVLLVAASETLENFEKRQR